MNDDHTNVAFIFIIGARVVAPVYSAGRHIFLVCIYFGTLCRVSCPTQRALDGVLPSEAGDLTPDDVRKEMAWLPKPRRQ